MRTDMKYGILAGLIIALGIVVYIFSGGRGGGDQSTNNNPAPDHDIAAVTPPSGGAPVTPPRPAPADSGAVHISDIRVTGPGEISTDLASGPLPPTPVAPAPAEDPTAVIPRIADTAVVVPPSPTPPAAMPPVVSLRVSGGVSDFGPSPTPPAVVTPVPVAPPASTGAGGTYTVEKGDNFWIIAEKKYGDGSKYELLAKANPGVDSSHLRVGQKLIIPPPPTPATPAISPGPRGVAPTAPRTVAPTTVASDEYVVVEGDLGFWGIAKKRYGDGSKWYLIEKANPTVDPRQLRVGMRLKVPALTEADRPAKPATTTRPAPLPRTPAVSEPPSDDRPRFDIAQ